MVQNTGPRHAIKGVSSHYHLVNLTGPGEYNDHCYLQEDDNSEIILSSEYIYTIPQSIFGGLSYTIIAFAGTLLNLVVMLAFSRHTGIRKEYLGAPILSLVTSDFLVSRDEIYSRRRYKFTFYRSVLPD